MKNKYFPDEDITEDDLYFVCYMIERVARHIKQKNKYVVNTIGRDGLYHLLSCANVLHCENPLKVEEDWISDYDLKTGDYITYKTLLIDVVKCMDVKVNSKSASVIASKQIAENIEIILDYMMEMYRVLYRIPNNM